MSNKDAIEWIEYMWTEYEGVDPYECENAVKMAIKALKTMKGYKSGFSEGYQKGYAEGYQKGYAEGFNVKEDKNEK